MRADLSRSQQRLLGAHEIGHVAINSADVRRLETEDGYFLGGEEKEVDEFRNEIVLPRHRLVEMMEQGYTQEEMCWETGLEPDQLLKIYTDQVKSVYRRDL